MWAGYLANMPFFFVVSAAGGEQSSQQDMETTPTAQVLSAHDFTARSDRNVVQVSVASVATLTAEQLQWNPSQRTPLN